MERKMRITKKWKNRIVTTLLSLLMICGMLPMVANAAGELVELTSLNVSPTFVTNNTNTSGLSIEGAYKVNDPTGAVGANIVIKLTPKDAEYVGAITGTTYFDNEKYFDTLPTITPDGNMGTATSTIDSEGNIIVTIPFTGGTINAQGNFTVNFPFDHTMFDAKIPNGTPLADVEVTITKDTSISTQTASITSSTTEPVLTTSVSGGGEMVANIGKGSTLSSGGDNQSQWRYEPGSFVTLRYIFPEGSVLTPQTLGNGVFDSVTNSVTFTFGPADENGIVTGYSSAWNHQGRTLMFPSSEFDKDEPFVIDSNVTYILWGASEKTNTKETSGVVRYLEEQPHMDPNKISAKYLGISPVGVNILEPAKQGTAAHSYAFSAMEYNEIQSNVPDLKVTWYNDSGINKAKPIQISFVNAGIGNTLRYMVYVKGIDDVIRTYTSLSTANNDLQEGEYIEKIEMFPTYEGIDQLVYGSTPDIRVYYGSWANGSFPNGTLIEHGDVSNVTATISWPNEVAPEMFTDIDTDPNTTTVQLDSLSVVYYETLIQPIITVSRNSDIDNNPEDIVSTSIQIQNRAQAINTWDAPELYILPPEMTTIDPDQDFPVRAYGTNEPLGNATIEGPMTVEGIEGEVYKLTLPSEISLTISHSNGSNNESNTCLVDVDYTIKNGTLAGSYYIAGAPSTLYPNTHGRILAASANDNYIYTTTTLEWDDTTTDLDNNPDTSYLPMANTGAPFNVRAVNTLEPDAQMYNAEEGEWQLLTNPDAHSTVPLEGTGQVKLTVSNKGNSYIGDVRLLDILPYVGDTQVLSPYDARNSQWDALLNAEPVVKITDGVGNDKTADFTYHFRYSSLSDPTYNTGGISRTGAGAFSDNATATTAKSFDFSLTERLPAGYTIEILLTIKAPAEADEDQIDDVAYNSFVVNGNFYSTATGGSSIQNGVPFEPGNQEFILTEIPTASITNLDGRVFKDLNNNDVYDVGVDTPYAGLPVEIYVWDTENNEVTGEAIKTVTTGVDGSYLFEALYSGTYVTRVIKPTGEAYQFAEQGPKSNSNDSHVDSNGYGYPVTVNPGGLTKLNENAGIQATGSVTVRYKAGSTQIGSDVKTTIPFTSDTMSGSILAGSTTYPIPSGYHLITSETASKNYSLGWGGTTDQVIEYQIEKDTYTITYSYTNTPVGVPALPVSQTVGWGTDQTVATAPVLPGYSFSGWTSSDVSVSSGSYSMPQKNVTFSGTWTLLDYDITYNYDGGTAPSTLNPDGYNVEDTFPISIGNEPTKLGYTFSGWTVDYSNPLLTDSTTAIKNYSIPSGTTGDITLTAKWTVNSYNITYEYSGGVAPTTSNPSSYTIEDTTPIQKIVVSNEPTRDGYTFSGWTIEYSNSVLIDITTPTKIYTVPMFTTGDIKLTAVWTINSYILDFDLNDEPTSLASGKPENQTVTYGAKAIEPSVPTRDGYTFDGWYEDEECTNPFDFDSETMPGSNKTLYAKWNINTYTITYEPGSQGAFTSDIHEEVPYGSSIPSYNGTMVDGKPIGNPGYIFIGWDKEPTGSVTKDVIYTAQWEEIPVSYTVEHYLQQGDGTYKLQETVSLTGTTNTTVNAVIKEYDGYVFVEDVERNILTGVVKGDGSLVLKVYYNAVKKPSEKPDQPIKVTENDHTVDTSGVSTGDNTNSSLFIATMLGMLGMMVVLRNRKEE